MIIIADPVHFGDTHHQVNAAFVASIGALYPSSDICIFAEQEQATAIKERLQLPMQLKTFEAYNKHRHFYWIRKIWGECKQIVAVFKNAKRAQPSLLIWLSLFPTGHLLVNILQRLFLKSQSQLIILHGELEYLGSQKKKKSEFFLATCLKAALKIASNKTHYIGLGTHIPKSILSSPVHFHTLSHPFIFSEYMEKRPIHQPLRICTFGTIKQSKNAALFYQLAGHFAPEILSGKVVFNVIGKVFDDMLPFRSKWVNEYQPDTFMPYALYEAAIREQDVALFFYDEEMYRYSASGAMMEAINLSLPILSMNNACFAALNESEELGRSGRSFSAILEYVDRLIQAPEEYLQPFNKGKIMFLQQNSFPLQVQNLKRILACMDMGQNDN